MSAKPELPALNVLVGGKHVAARFLAEEMRRTIGDGAVLVDVAMMQCSLNHRGEISHFVVSGIEEVPSAALARKQLGDLMALAASCGAGLILVIKGGSAIELLGLSPESVNAMVLVDRSAGPDGTFSCAAGAHPSIQATLQDIFAMLADPASCETARQSLLWGHKGAFVKRLQSPEVQNDLGWFVATLMLSILYGAMYASMSAEPDWPTAWCEFMLATALNHVPAKIRLSRSGGFASGVARGAIQFVAVLAATALAPEVVAWLISPT